MSAICVQNNDMETLNETLQEGFLARKKHCQQNMSGSAMSSLIKGESAEVEECGHDTRRLVHHAQPQRCHFTCPQDFFGGPKVPGKITHGTRRCQKNVPDTVGMMFTDKYALSAAEFQRVNRSRPACLTNTCAVITPETPHRPSLRINAPHEQMDAPYFEDNDPKPQRDQQPVCGRKHFSVPENAFRVGRNLDEYANKQTSKELQNRKAGCQNRANRSVNVLTLSQSEQEDGKETRPSSRQHWVAKYEAPQMPPARRPIIRRMCVPANEVHGVLCSNPENQGAQNNGAHARPVRQGMQRCTFNIFAPPPECAQPKCTKETSNILNYYDPSRDQPVAAPHVRAGAYRVNQQTSEAPPAPYGKNSGMYKTKNSMDKCQLVWP